MNNYDLSVIIVGRNEEFLAKTVAEVFEKRRGKTEVIVVCDVVLPDPPIPPHPDATLIFNQAPVGQRAATNMGAKISTAKYIMKLDAHCALDEGFDVKMMESMQDNWTMIPVMRNLHAFDWVCPEGHRRYQGPSGPCKDCGKATMKDVVWIAKTNPQSIAYCFDRDMHFQYQNDYGKKQTGDITETMSIQGSCFMVTRERYFALDICSEVFSGWGQQGVEVACKTWLSGGRVVVNRKTWYAHMFRTQGGDFGFPYENPQSKINENRQKTKELFRDDNWPGAIHKFQWLIDKFNPPGWEKRGLTKGAIFYSDSQLSEKIARPVREQLLICSQEKNIPIVSASLKRMDFGVKNIHFPSLRRGYLSMFKQIIGALENSNADVVQFCEHDVWYSKESFDFMPPDRDTFYYNNNVWRVRLSDGHALKTKDCKQLSGLCVWRETALIHFRERYKMADEKHKELVKEDGDETEFNRWIRYCGFEPMTHNRIQWKNTFKCDSWESKVPILDIKHGLNSTGERWKKEQYRNQKWTEGWTESEGKIPGWGDINPILNLMR